jgi:multiple sugar transport system substrate-binding protein
MPHQGGVGLVWFNRNHFKEAGLDPAKPPTTWDQTVQAIQRLTRRAGTATERAGWVPQRGWGVPWMVMYWQLGGELLDPTEKKAVFNNERATQVFDWLLRVHDLQGGEDAITELYAGANNYDAFAQGKVSMVWAPNSTWQAQWASRSELDVGNTFWPTPPGGKRSNYMGGWSLIVPKGAKNPDAAFAYLEYKLGDDPQVRWALDWDSTPSTRTAATNERYVNSSPERKTAVEDMPFAKWVIAAPGGDQALKFQTGVANNVFQRKMTVREALDDAVRSVQNELDEAARACGT